MCSSSFNIESDRGFTLVELAITMIIIGLLITGVLKGQEIITNSRVTKTISQIQNYMAAYHTFNDIYGDIPGDISNPGARLPNCINSCAVSGNENGYLDSDVFNGMAVETEGTNLFTHLAASDLISGISTNPDNSQFDYGEESPNSFINGVGFRAGNFFDTRNYLGLAPENNEEMDNSYSMNKEHAFKIDKAIDDGLAGSGIMRSVSDGTCHSTNYLLSDAGNACNATILLK